MASFCYQQISEKLPAFCSIPEHELAAEFSLLTSGKRYAMAVCRVNRHLKSFITSAVQVLNLDVVSAYMGDAVGVQDGKILCFAMMYPCHML